MIVFLIIIGLHLLAIQYLITFARLHSSEFNSKKHFLLNMIPFYCIYVLLFEMIPEMIENFKDL